MLLGQAGKPNEAPTMTCEPSLRVGEGEQTALEMCHPAVEGD